MNTHDFGAPDTGRPSPGFGETDLGHLPQVQIVAAGEAALPKRGLSALWERVAGTRLPTRPDEWMARGAGTLVGGVTLMAASHIGCLLSLGVALAAPGVAGVASPAIGLTSIASAAFLGYKAIKVDDCCGRDGETAPRQVMHALYAIGAVIALMNGYTALTTNPRAIAFAAEAALATGQNLFQVMGSICVHGAELTP
jgi:hypothetical protein